MLTPFVGRTRELHRMRQLLEDGRNIVVTGPFGSGRTALVRELGLRLAQSHVFIFRDVSHSRMQIRRAIEDALFRNGRAPKYAIHERSHSRGIARSAPRALRPVLVLDDVARVTSQKVTLIRHLVRSEQCQFIMIVERFCAPRELARLRAVLGAAPLSRLGPLSLAAVERCVTECARACGFDWSASEIRSMARATHGFPLGMRLTLEAAIRSSQAPQRSELSQTDPARGTLRHRY